MSLKAFYSYIKENLLPPPQDLVLLAIFFLAFAPIHSNDFWWHLKIGNIIYSEGTIPDHDIFHLATDTARWLNFSWLGELIFYKIFSAIGLPFLIFFKAAIITISFLFLTRTWHLRESSMAARLICLLLIAINAADFWYMRPEIFTYLLFTISIFIVERSRISGGRSIFALPLLAALWANLHHGYLIGLLYIVLNWATLSIMPEKYCGSCPTRKEPAISPRTFHLVFLFSLIAFTLNPFTYHAYLFPFRLLAKASLLSHLTEWQPPNLTRDIPLVIYLFLFVGTAIARRKEIRIDTALRILPFLALALSSRRNIFFFCVVSSPVVIAGWPELTSVFSRMHRRRRDYLTGITGIARREVKTGSIALAFILILWGGKSIADSRDMSAETESERWVAVRFFPVEGCSYLKNNDMPGQLFSYDGWGGYLLWHLFPKYRIFYDGRGIFGTREVEVYRKIVSVDPQANHFLTHFGIASILFPKRSSLASYLERHPGWRCVMEGKIEKLFTRNADYGMNFAAILNKL